MLQLCNRVTAFVALSVAAGLVLGLGLSLLLAAPGYAAPLDEPAPQETLTVDLSEVERLLEEQNTLLQQDLDFQQEQQYQAPESEESIPSSLAEYIDSLTPESQLIVITSIILTITSVALLVVMFR